MNQLFLVLTQMVAASFLWVRGWLPKIPTFSESLQLTTPESVDSIDSFIQDGWQYQNG